MDRQNAALRRLIAHAYRNVCYYHDLFERNGIGPHQVRTVADLPIIPVTGKDDLRDRPPEDVLARGLDPGRLLAVRTSGSVGEPFTVRFTPWEQRVLTLSWARPMRYFGRRAGDRLVALVYMRPELEHGAPLYEHLRNALGVFRTTYVNMCLPPEEVLQGLRRCRPDILAGYPGVLAHLADAAEAADAPTIRPRAVCTGGEVITDAVRRRIARAFGAPVYNCYASEEFRVIAWECRETGELHTCNGHVIVEVLKDGRPAAPGEDGELVATSLFSYAMPFIRYRLGDIVTRGEDQCRCGLPYSTIQEVKGRTLDYFPLPDGRMLHPYDIIRPLHDTADWVKFHQLVQERRDLIVLYSVPYRSPSAQEVKRLQEAMRPVLGPGVEFCVQVVPEIKPRASGKYAYARSLVH
jgi:phenylacetate-CoA ligase